MIDELKIHNNNNKSGLHEFRPKNFSARTFGPKKKFFISKSNDPHSDLSFTPARQIPGPKLRAPIKVNGIFNINKIKFLLGKYLRCGRHKQGKKKIIIYIYTLKKNKIDS